MKVIVIYVYGRKLSGREIGAGKILLCLAKTANEQRDCWERSMKCFVCRENNCSTIFYTFCSFLERDVKDCGFLYCAR